MIEQASEHVPSLVTKFDLTYKTDFQQLQQKDSHGKLWSENFFGSSKEVPMSADLLNSLMENLERTWLDEIQSGLLTQTTKAETSVMSTTTLQNSWAQFTDTNGATSVGLHGLGTRQTVSIRSSGLSMNYEPIPIRDDSYFQRGPLTKYTSWPFRLAIRSPNIVSITVA